GVEQPHVTEGQTGEEGSAHRPDLDSSREHLPKSAFGHSGEQLPSGLRAHERRQRSQEYREQPHKRPQRGSQRSAHHQNACPTANWTTTRRQNPPGSPGRTSWPVNVRLLLAVFRKYSLPGSCG